MELVKSLESCAWNNDNCDLCPVKEECRHLYDSLANSVTHYQITESQHRHFMAQFRSLKKQLL